jgi:hypothetical protein
MSRDAEGPQTTDPAGVTDLDLGGTVASMRERAACSIRDRTRGGVSACDRTRPSGLETSSLGAPQSAAAHAVDVAALRSRVIAIHDKRDWSHGATAPR